MKLTTRELKTILQPSGERATTNHKRWAEECGAPDLNQGGGLLLGMNRFRYPSLEPVALAAYDGDAVVHSLSIECNFLSYGTCVG